MIENILNLIIKISSIILFCLVSILLIVSIQAYSGRNVFFDKFHKNKYLTLTNALNKKDCQNVIYYFMSYYEDRELKNSDISNKITFSCGKTAIYQYYLFMKSINEKNLGQAQEIYHNTKNNWPHEEEIIKEQEYWLNHALKASVKVYLDKK